MKIRSTKIVIDRPWEITFKNEELNCDQLEDNDVIAETIITAISPGTEIAAYTGAPPLRPTVQYPRLVGYCNVARVVCTGPLVDGLEVGSRILTFSSHCSHFKINKNDVLAKVPPNIKSEDAACTYLYHLGYSAVLRSDIRLGSSVVVIGLGVLGLTSTKMAAKSGAKVFAVSEHSATHVLAMKFGAKQCFKRSEMGALIAALGEHLSQSVITTSNSWADWDVALRVAGNQGVIAVLGFPGRGADHIPLNPLDSKYFYQKQLKIYAAGMSPELPNSRGFLPFNERQNIQRILDWIAEEEIIPQELVSGTFDARSIKQAYEQLISRKNSPVTYLLRWGNAEEVSVYD